jgi:hypothetical protein
MSWIKWLAVNVIYMSLVIDASDSVSILRVKRRIFSRLKGFEYLSEKHECYCPSHPVHLSDCLSILY